MEGNDVGQVKIHNHLFQSVVVNVQPSPTELTFNHVLGSYWKASASCRCQVLRENRNSQVCPDAIERVHRCSLLFLPRAKIVLGPWCRCTSRAQLDPYPGVLAFDSRRLRLQCFPHRVQSPDSFFGSFRAHQKIDHHLPVIFPLFLIASSPIKLILYVHIEHVFDSLPFLHDLLCRKLVQFFLSFFFSFVTSSERPVEGKCVWSIPSHLVGGKECVRANRDLHTNRRLTLHKQIG